VGKRSLGQAGTGEGLVDGNALITAAFGAVIGAVLMYRIPKRQWWAAIGQSAIPLAAVLNYAAQGHPGSSVHIIIAINMVILTIVFVGAIYADYKLRIRKSPSLQCPGEMLAMHSSGAPVACPIR
jgi:hypothetical protein